MEAGRPKGHETNGLGGDVRPVSSEPDREIGMSCPTSDDMEPEWSPSAEWLAGEDRADDDIRTGRVRRFDSVEELLADLHAASTESKLGAD